jgi:hypothetical protein
MKEEQPAATEEGSLSSSGGRWEEACGEGGGRIQRLRSLVLFVSHAGVAMCTPIGRRGEV